MQNIKNKFEEIYPLFSFPEGAEKGILGEGSLTIRYLFAKDEQGEPYLDTYSSHKMGSIHLRIKFNGEVETLETYQEGFSFDPNIAGDEERAEKEYRTHNEKVGRLLSDKFY